MGYALDLYGVTVERFAPLASCEKLIDLRAGVIHADGFEPLYGLKNLKRPWLSYGYFPKEKEQAIVAAMPWCDILFKHSYDVGLHWRCVPRYREMRAALGWRLESIPPTPVTE